MVQRIIKHFTSPGNKVVTCYQADCPVTVWSGVRGPCVEDLVGVGVFPRSTPPEHLSLHMCILAALRLGGGGAGE
jgi:hypothetical protein